MWVIAPWLKRPNLLILAGAMDEEIFKVVPLYRFNRSAVTKSSSVLDNSMVLAVKSVPELPTLNAIPASPPIETMPEPAATLLCSANFAAVKSIMPPAVVTESATVILLPMLVSAISPFPDCWIPKPSVVRS